MGYEELCEGNAGAVDRFFLQEEGGSDSFVERLRAIKGRLACERFLAGEEADGLMEEVMEGTHAP